MDLLVLVQCQEMVLGTEDMSGKNQKAVFHLFHKAGQIMEDFLPIYLRVSTFSNVDAFINISVCLYVDMWVLWSCTAHDMLVEIRGQLAESTFSSSSIMWVPGAGN